MKYRFVIFQDGLGSVSEVSWAPFWSSRGSLGRPLEALGGLLGDLRGLPIEHKRVTRIESMSLGALDVFCWPRFVILLLLPCVLSSFFWILRMSQLKTSLLIRIRRTSQLKTSFWRSENSCCYCFWRMFELKSVFFKMRGMSQWITSLVSGDITVWILTFLLILEVFPS